MRITDVTTNSISLAWEASPADRSNAVGQYLIEIKADDDEDFTLYGRVDGRQLQYTCEYLRRGRTYQFRVKGKNSAGLSPVTAILNNYVSLKEGVG